MDIMNMDIVASLLTSNIGELLIFTKSATLTRILCTDTWKKYCLKVGFNPCPRKFVVKIVSTDLVGTLKCFYSKCSQNPCRKNNPTRLVVDGLPQG